MRFSRAAGYLWLAVAAYFVFRGRDPAYFVGATVIASIWFAASYVEDQIRGGKR